MGENIKKIVSEFIKIPVEQINENTGIGRPVLANSILVHRMYAAIAKEGFEINNYQEINNYGELLNRISGNQQAEKSFPSIVANNNFESHNQTHGIGIDIEEISNLPLTNDFREEEFYKMNFTSQEISFCNIQPDPYASFTGLFAVKEAIVKANSYYRNIPFNKIFVDHLEDGKPVFGGFQISISHTNNIAIAVAVKDSGNLATANVVSSYNEPSKSQGLIFVLSVLAIILAVVAIVLTILK